MVTMTACGMVLRMPIDPDIAIGLRLPPQDFSWTSEDVIRYHLALGAGANYSDARELRYVRGSTPCVLPTFGMTAPAALGVAAPAFYHPGPPEIRFPGVELSLSTLLHASQEIVVHRPLDSCGTARASARVVDVLDKGSAAILMQEAELVDAAGRPVLSFASSIFARGEGGCGGHRGASADTRRKPPPDVEPDAVLRTPTLPQQALLYQMCGERNPVHTDPEHARRAGFARPIIQGVCIFGMVCKTIVDVLLDADPASVTRCTANFLGVVFPGETLSTSVWRNGPELRFQSSVEERQDRLVLGGTVRSA